MKQQRHVHIERVSANRHNRSVRYSPLLSWLQRRSTLLYPKTGIMITRLKVKVKCKPAYQRLTVFRQDREHFHNRKNRTHKATPHMVFGRPQANEWTYHLSLFANSNEDIDLIAEMQTPPLQKNLQEFRTKLRKSHHFDIRMLNISCFHTRKCEAKQLLIETKNTRLYRFQWEVGLQLLLIYRVVLFLY